MEMIEVKTAELAGPALDWAVAHAIGHKPRTGPGCAYPVEIIDWGRPGTQVNGCRFEPSTDWSQGGPLIEKYNLAFRVRHYEVDALYDAYSKTYVAIGKTHLVAACRAIVYARLGEVVKIPQELA